MWCKVSQSSHGLNILFSIALRGSLETLKRAYSIYLIVLLVFMVYGFSLSFIDIDPDVFLTFLSSGYFILGVIFGVMFRKRFLNGAVTAFPLTFLSWLIASAIFSSLSGISAVIQAFSEDLPNVLMAGLVFSFITFAAVLLTAMVFKLFHFVSQRISKKPSPN